LPDIAGPGRTIVGWVGSVIGVSALIFGILVYVAIHNGRKHVLQLINTLKGVKK
jgi:membrane associated rhomboid family serine protease